MLETAKSFCGTVAFAHVDSDLEDHSRILEIFDLTAAQLLAIRTRLKAIRLTINNKIEPHYSSQKLPDDWNNGLVKTLVQSNIISVSHDPSKAVLVEFYAPWCGICQRMEPVYNLLGTHFKNHSDVFVAKIYATHNKIPPSIHIRRSLRLFYSEKENINKKSENIQQNTSDGDRTRDRWIRSPALYPLSYRGVTFD
ncbi:hypothetical protein GJ496_000174 [Pomphorhynchus laevis]|nr:hypothetical protein GJ496_000174 [Pomphorhynchus laevis]